MTPHDLSDKLETIEWYFEEIGQADEPEGGFNQLCMVVKMLIEVVHDVAPILERLQEDSPYEYRKRLIREAMTLPDPADAAYRMRELKRHIGLAQQIDTDQPSKSANTLTDDKTTPEAPR